MNQTLEIKPKEEKKTAYLFTFKWDGDIDSTTVSICRTSYQAAQKRFWDVLKDIERTRRSIGLPIGLYMKYQKSDDYRIIRRLPSW